MILEKEDLVELARVANAAMELREAKLAFAKLQIPPKYWGAKHGKRLPFDSDAHNAAEGRVKQAEADFNRIVDSAITKRNAR